MIMPPLVRTPPVDRGFALEVERVLDGFFDRGTRASVREEHVRLWEALRAAADGGKRLRPALFGSLYSALGGTDAVAAAHVGAALELLHTALVIHDDVIDRDSIRRGRPNVIGTFTAIAGERGYDSARAEHYGSTAGLLAGDLALAGAVRTLAACSAPPEMVATMLDLFEEALRTTASGELWDVGLALGGGHSSEAEWLDEAMAMEDAKTAVYSVELPLRLAAVLSGQRAAEPVFTDYARSVGLAYQLRDDLDGMFGDEERTGKNPVSDLQERKLTALIAFARRTSSWPELELLMGCGDPGLGELTRARVLLEECGARAGVEQLVDDLLVEARRSIVGLPQAALLVEWAHILTRTEES